MPSYKPIDYTPGTLVYGAAKPPPPPEEEVEPKKENRLVTQTNRLPLFRRQAVAFLTPH